MAATIRDAGWGIIVEAAPAGEYGFGTIGAANPERTLEEAWRMVQRAGLARIADRESGQLMVGRMGTRCEVEYQLRPDADLATVNARNWRD